MNFLLMRKYISALTAKTVMVMLLLCVNQVNLWAQVSFDKKSGNFSANGAIIAKLESEKVKANGKGWAVGKSFIVKDVAGTKELLAYRLGIFNDTFGNPTEYYFTIECKELGYQAYRPQFEAINSFKEAGETIVAENLLNTDGTVNTQVAKAYFQKNTEQNGDYKARHLRIQDSLMKLVAPAGYPRVERRGGEIKANEYGKVGQGNTEIGQWELSEITEKTAIGEKKYYTFYIRNIEGDIVQVSHIELGGAHSFIFKDHVGLKEETKVLDLINNNPLQNIYGQMNFITEQAKNLVRLGIL